MQDCPVDSVTDAAACPVQSAGPTSKRQPQASSPGWLQRSPVHSGGSVICWPLCRKVQWTADRLEAAASNQAGCSLFTRADSFHTQDAGKTAGMQAAVLWRQRHPIRAGCTVQSPVRSDRSVTGVVPAVQDVAETADRVQAAMQSIKLELKRSALSVTVKLRVQPGRAADPLNLGQGQVVENCVVLDILSDNYMDTMSAMLKVGAGC